MILIIKVLIFCFILFPGPLWSENIYVSQSGTGDGSSCDSPFSAAWFNSSGNWGDGAGKISAGDSVYLCGTFTSDLTFQGSGTDGNNITLDGTAATMSNARITTGDSSNSRDYLTIQNLTWASGANQLLLYIWGSWYVTVDNLYADNINSGGMMIVVDNAPRGSGTNKPHNITIKNSFVRSVAGDGGGQADIFSTSGSYNVLIEGNKFVHRYTGAGHNDIIQTYAGGHAAPNRPSDYTVRFNWFEIDTTDANDHSFFMVEELDGTNHVYGNVVYFKASGGGVSPWQWGSSTNDTRHYNNTVVYKVGAGHCIGIDDGPITNNIVYGSSGSHTWISSNCNPSCPTLSYNLWYNGTHAAWVPPIEERPGDIQGSDPLFADYTNADFSLQASSPAKATGTNLEAGPADEWIAHKYNYGVAPGATWPNPTLALRSSWDMGAYVYEVTQSNVRGLIITGGTLH